MRVVSGDIGGSFGMKSAVYNEVALVLWAAKVTGRPVKWISTRSEAFLSDGQARDNVTDAELALDKDGNFLGLRVNIDRQCRRIPADRRAVLRRQSRHAGRRLQDAGGVCRRDRGADQHQSGAALSRQRPPGVRPMSSSAWSMSPPTSSASIRRCCGGRIRSRRRRCRTRPGSPSPTIPASSRRTWTRPCTWPTPTASRSAARNRASAASCAGIGMSNTIERAAAPSTEGAEIRFDRGGTITLFSGSNNQGQGHETAFKQIVCDRLGVDPKDVTYISGDTDTVFYGEGTGGSRSGDARRLRGRRRRRQGDRRRARRSPRTCSRSASRTSSSRTACSRRRRATRR